MAKIVKYDIYLIINVVGLKGGWERECAINRYKLSLRNCFVSVCSKT